MSRANQAARQQPERKRSAAGSKRPSLSVIDHGMLKRQARHRRLVMGSIVMMASCLFAVAFVHAELVQSQHTLDEVNAEIDDGLARTAQLEREVMVASSPVAIVERAEALGMVRSQNPEYLVAVHYEPGNTIFGSADEVASQENGQ